MNDVLSRIVGDLIGRFDGPLDFRLILQPVMAMGLAIRDGYKDAVAGRAPYFWAVLTKSGQRAGLLRECWDAIKRVFIFAVVMDVIYQFMVFRWIYPVEALIVAPILAFVPYLLIRGPVRRLLGVRTRQPLGR